MSLILDALNKSEQDRPEHGATPGLHTIHHAAPQEGRRRLWVVWPLATVIFASLALGLWLGQTADAPAPTPVAPTPAPDTADEAPLSELLAEPTNVVAPEPAIVAADSAAEAALVQDSRVAALYAPVTQQKVPVPQQEDTPVAIDIEAMTQAAQQALAERPAAEHEVPLISELRQTTKDEIPSLFFTAHRWGSSPQDKDVVLNGKTYHEGDLVKPGLRLTEILRDSIVLDYQGTEFRLNSLNSWVNL